MGNFAGPAAGMAGFAVALALPFTLFAIFPSWLKQAPRSGGWMNSVKVVLGFLELALSLKFLSVADLAYGWGLLDREVFICLWVVIFAMLGFLSPRQTAFQPRCSARPCVDTAVSSFRWHRFRSRFILFPVCGEHLSKV